MYGMLCNCQFRHNRRGLEFVLMVASLISFQVQAIALLSVMICMHLVTKHMLFTGQVVSNIYNDKTKWNTKIPCYVLWHVLITMWQH